MHRGIRLGMECIVQDTRLSSAVLVIVLCDPHPDGIRMIQMTKNTL